MELDPGRVRLLGDPGTPDGRGALGELFDAFLPLARRAVADIRAAVDEGDVARAAALAHAQKGASGMIGAPAIAAAFASLERPMAGTTGIRRTLDDLETALDRLAVEADALLGRPGAP